MKDRTEKAAGAKALLKGAKEDLKEASVELKEKQEAKD